VFLVTSPLFNHAHLFAYVYSYRTYIFEGIATAVCEVPETKLVEKDSTYLLPFPLTQDFAL